MGFVMNDDRNDNTFDKDDTLDFIIFKKLEEHNREQKGNRGGCLSIVVLLLLPAASVMLLCWKR